MRAPDPTQRYDQLCQGLEAAGLVVLDAISAGKRTDIAVGSAGDAFWDAVRVSREWVEGYDNPIDSYTIRVVRTLLRNDDGEDAFFPNDPDAPNLVKLWPATFPRLAASDLGPMIHQKYGLWMAARAHIMLPQAYFKFETAPVFDPCEACLDKPCLSACPVGAFTGPKHYDHLACAAHLLTTPACFSGGCDARAACPYGQSWQLPKDQAEYHQHIFRSTYG